MNRQFILNLLAPLDLEIPWVDEFIRLSNERGVELSSPTPGKEVAVELLANTRIHKQTTSDAGVRTYGFDEFIATLEGLSPNDVVSSVGLTGSNKRGILYFTSDNKVLGGIVLPRRIQAIGGFI